MRTPFRLSLVAVALTLLAAGLPAMALGVTVMGQVTTSDPQSTGRPIFGGAQQSCAASSGYPGTLAGTWHYDAHTFRNTSASVQCVSVTTTHPCGGDRYLRTVAYGPSFSPSNVAQNFLGHFSDLDCGFPRTFMFNVPAASTFQVVVWETTQGSGSNAYTLDVTGIGVVLPVVLRSVSALRLSTGVVLRWRTASEHGLLGFNLYREVAGQRVRVNQRLIPSSFGASRSGRSYSFVDRRAPRSARAIRYRLQAVHLDGSRSWLGTTLVAS